MWNCGTVEPLFLDISPVLLLMTFFQTGGAGEFRKNLNFGNFNFGLLISYPGTFSTITPHSSTAPHPCQNF